jgi:hypothetical protein
MARKRRPQSSPGDYRVGYGQPPRSGQFRKGQSGNPKGRPKGTKNLKIDLMEELQERILVREAGREKRLSKQRALLKALTATAIKGDPRSANIVLSMVFRLFEDDPASQPDQPLTAEEWNILENLNERMSAPTKPVSRPRLKDRMRSAKSTSRPKKDPKA